MHGHEEDALGIADVHRQRHGHVGEDDAVLEWDQQQVRQNHFSLRFQPLYQLQRLKCGSLFPIGYRVGGAVHELGSRPAGPISTRSATSRTRPIRSSWTRRGMPSSRPRSGRSRTGRACRPPLDRLPRESAIRRRGNRANRGPALGGSSVTFDPAGLGPDGEVAAWDRRSSWPSTPTRALRGRSATRIAPLLASGLPTERAPIGEDADLMKTIIVGYDGTSSAEPALGRAVEQAHAFGGKVTWSCVVAPHPIDMSWRRRIRAACPTRRTRSGSPIPAPTSSSGAASRAASRSI